MTEMSVLEPLAVSAESPECREAARSLADRLGLPCRFPADAAAANWLVETRQGLELRDAPGGPEGPVRVDFLSGAARFRQQRGEGWRQPLARAVGFRANFRPVVLDATAGLGGDAFVLAALGARVTLVERAPAVAALLRDGLARGRSGPEPTRCAVDRMRLLEGDAVEVMAGWGSALRPDSVYLDPMHPIRRKSALVKKAMRRIRAVVGEDPDAARLLSAALAFGAPRIAVKRPRDGAPLDGPPPAYSLKGKSTRYDVYLPS